MKTNITLGIAVIAIVIAIISASSHSTTVTKLGGTTNYDALELSQGLTVGGHAVLNGGTLTVTTANTATSTVIAGCYQFYATSTATALKFQASTTPGIMYSQYGTCPNL